VVVTDSCRNAGKWHSGPGNCAYYETNCTHPGRLFLLVGGLRSTMSERASQGWGASWPAAAKRRRAPPGESVPVTARCALGTGSKLGHQVSKARGSGAPVLNDWPGGNQYGRTARNTAGNHPSGSTERNHALQNRSARNRG